MSSKLDRIIGMLDADENEAMNALRALRRQAAGEGTTVRDLLIGTMNPNTRLRMLQDRVQSEANWERLHEYSVNSERKAQRYARLLETFVSQRVLEICRLQMTSVMGMTDEEFQKRMGRPAWARGKSDAVGGK